MAVATTLCPSNDATHRVRYVNTHTHSLSHTGTHALAQALGVLMQRAHTHEHDALTHALTRSHTGDGTRGCVAHTHTDMADVTEHRWATQLVLHTGT